MSETDALSNFKFPKGRGKFVTFADGDEFKLRILTTDPLVSTTEYTDKKTGEVSLNTRFAFTVWNFTLEKAQILNAGGYITKEIQRLHQDEEWGANIRKINIKIAAEGEMLTRKYTVTPLPKAEALTNEQIRECQTIDLEATIPNSQRMSFYDPEEEEKKVKKAPTIDDIPAPTDEEMEEPINLDDIPF